MTAAAEKIKLLGEPLELRYVPLSTVVQWEDNPKRHDEGSLRQAIERYGFVDPPKFDDALGALVYGNGRSHVVQEMKREGAPRPRGVLERPGDGEWYLPVKFGVDSPNRAEAVALAIDHNNLTMLGGDFTPYDVAKMWEHDSYLDVLKGLANEGDFPVTVDGDDLDALLAPPPPPAKKPPADTSSKLGGLLFKVVVTCADEQGQTELLARLRGDGYDAKPLIS